MYCCFTGHRPESLKWLLNEHSDRVIALKQVLADAIEGAINEGFCDFYCGMARGIDTFAAEEVIRKMPDYPDLRLHAVLPCPEQHLPWSEQDRKRFQSNLEYASSKTIISPLYTKTCMLSRNRFMVDNSERLIAVWNGFFKGGTAYTVRYAKNEQKEIYLIRPRDLSVSKI